MVEVFVTNVSEKEHSHFIKMQLLKRFPEAQINFDLEDCDKILRIEDKTICSEKIINLLQTHGFMCEVLL